MADLYSQTIVGDGVSTYTVGGNTKRIFPSSEFGTPKVTPIILDAGPTNLPGSGNSRWVSDQETDEENYLITSEYQTQGDVFKAVQAIQQYCDVHEVGCTSDSTDLTVFVRDSSIPYNAGDTFQDAGNVITKLQTAVRAALGGAEVDVTIGRVTDDDTDG
jgi:hypothetical protein